MDIRQAFPSNYIKASDLQGQVSLVKIARVVEEELGTDQKPIQKPVIYFEGKTKGLVLNRTNSDAISADFGWDTDAWPEKVIELFSMKVPFNGQQVDAIRIRVPRQPPARATIAPNARDRASQPAMAEAAPAAPVEAYEDLDEIPF